MSKFSMAAMTVGLLLAANSAFADENHGSGHDEMMDKVSDHDGMMNRSDTQDGHHGDAMAFGEPGNADQVTRTIEFAMGDYFFEPESISVSAGETVRFQIRNEGTVVHEFNIGTAAMHSVHQEEMVMMVEHGVIDVDRINQDMMNMDMDGGQVMTHDDPNTVLLEPGQEAEIIWTFSGATGGLEFACNVPGHYDSGMMGPLTVTP